MSVSAPAFRAKLLGTLFCTLTALACGPGPESGEPEQQPELTESSAPVVYGNDDRQDVYAHPNATLRDRARQSTVALMSASALNTTNPNNVTFNGKTLGQYANLCTDQRFRNDPTAAYCSGTLIDDDLVLTAGHCVEDLTDCKSARFVFKYYRTAEGTLETVTTQDIFTCKALLARHLSDETEDTYVDFAIVQLDRSAAPRFTPAPVRPGDAPLAVGANVAVIGSGSGIPFKIDSGGSVRDNSAEFMDYFVATTDTFGGNSGSGVYETVNNTVAGILVFGDEDYVARGSCNVVNACTETGCEGEGIIYVHNAIKEFCARNSGNVRLCNATPPVPTKYTFTASSTASATRNTVNGTVTLAAGQKLTVGTCGVTGAAVTGDSYLRLRGPSGSEVASNDDGCDSGVGSKITYTATVAGTYEVRAGCYQNTSCGGTVAWEIAQASAATQGSFTFDVSNTANATTGTANSDVTLQAGQSLSFGSCGVAGASGTGDTVVRLFNAANQQVTFNDDACGSLSHAAYTAPTGAGGTYQIRVGCFGASACSGTVAWTIQ
ncbi:serine protease [Corallococcus exercitus]|uniref:Serine protease n=1 Tax=Corallococcus exercitus TaxID=2316736 RepID=A0A3A8HJ98_9BACT|nr:serine protease [Corallococcus exercitus]NOK38752.1 trypsin-like serine protease [Corallococcus exercitus]RKG70668.1 serine protease [Corallococcus exercitus]